MAISSGSSIFLSLLEDEGVKHLFGNPGTTELPIMNALRLHPDLNYVLGLQESVVVAMADGYARASGQLAACNVHVAPGLGNAMGSLFNAKFYGAPVLISAGQQEQGHGLTEPLLYDPLVPIASPLVKWASEVTRLQDLPRVVRRAAKIALSPPTGPVFLSLPGDILNEEDDLDLGYRTRVETQTRPADAVLDSLAERLCAAKNPVIIAGHEISSRNALQEAGDFASLLGAPVYQQTVPYSAQFQSTHPLFIGALSRHQPDVREKLAEHDVMVCLGGDILRMSVWHPVDAFPEHMEIIHISERDWELGKNYPTRFAIRANVQETLLALLPRLQAAQSDADAGAAAKRRKRTEDRNWTVGKATLTAQTAQYSDTTPIAADWLMHQLVQAIDDDVVVVDEAITASRSLLQFLPFTDGKRYFGLASGGIGFAIAGAVGIQLAQPSRPVLAVIGDGSALYNVQALWTAAHYDLPITYVIANNRSYRILKQRIRQFKGNDAFIGMDFDNPAIDWVGMAKAMGLTALRIEQPGDIHEAVRAAVKSGRPHLIDVVIDKSL